MPVQFKDTAEYSQKFVPLETDSHNALGASQIAGIKSDHIATCYEPPLQHKKRLDGPPSSLSTNYFTSPSNGSEYTLLGQQDKFASNVPYQLKKSGSHSKVYKNKENLDETPPTNKQLRMQKRTKPFFKERHPLVAHSPRQPPTKQTTLKSPPPAPRGKKPPEVVKDALKDKDLKDVLGDTSGKGMEVATKPSVPAARVKGKDQELKSNMNEFVQTDLKKGVAISGPEAPADYALKYKAKVAPLRPPKRFSEYQKQFQWKQGMKASPLLAAEQLVYKSSTDLGPYKTDAFPKQSEYRRQFQQWKPLASSTDLALNLDDANVNNNNNNNKQHSNAEEETQAKKINVKRSKSAGAVLRKEKQPASDNQEQDDGIEEVKEKLKKTFGKFRRLGTEYGANFKSPAQYNYTRGTWKGANPHHLTPATDANNNQNNSNNNNADSDEKAPLSNWFAEVIELRRRAEEYRKRAQGTHFSREHLVQLMARQNQCWDLDSDASATVKALDLGMPMLKQQWKSQPKACIAGKPVVGNSNIAIEGGSPVMSDVDDESTEMVEEQRKEGKPAANKGRRPNHRSRKMAFLEEQKESVARQHKNIEEQDKMEADSDDDDLDEGRRPTPVLQQTKTKVQRHHLDLTTPSVGGALLTCPPSKDNKIIITSRSGDSYVTASDDVQPVKSSKKTNMEELMTMPILGHPSSDTHALRDDYASEDRPLETQYVATPFKSFNDEDKENKNVAQKATPEGQNAKLSRLPPVMESYGKTFTKSKPSVSLTQDDLNSSDDDVMSVSMRSVTSSSSLASDVYERAKRRRQEFWGKKN